MASSSATFPSFGPGSAVPIILWNVETKTCRIFEDNPPKYIILSHSYEEDTDDSRLDFITNVAKEHGYSHVWLDPHCMGSTQDEISRSVFVTSMFKYYQGAEFCCLWLGTSDVKDGLSKHPCFKESWLLQDLLASTRIRVYSKERSFIGQIAKKTTLEQGSNLVDRFLRSMANSTGLPFKALAYSWPQIHSDYTVAQKISWAAGRTTRNPEDKAYSLLGILDVSIPVIYPECNAFMRLQQGVVNRHPNDQSIFAWGLGRSPESNKGGLWAESPDDFAECKLVRFKEHIPHVHGGLIQKTLRRTLLLAAPIKISELGSQNHLYALINCAVDAVNGNDSIGIPLCQNGDRIFRPAGIAPRPPLSLLSPFTRSPLNIEIAPDVCPHGKRRFSLVFEEGFGDFRNLSIKTIGHASDYRRVRDKDSDRIWHFESYLEAPAEEVHIEIRQPDPSMDFLAIKLRLGWSLNVCHWDIQDSSAALAKGDFENYQACLFYYGSVLRVKQPHAGVFCIVKDETPYQESA